MADDGPQQYYAATLNQDGTARSLFVSDQPLDPRPEGAIDLTPEQYQQWRAGRDTLRLVNGALVSFTPPPPPYDVSALLLTDRLAHAGLLRTALAALKLDAPLADITDAELVLRERWRSAVAFRSTDQDVRTFLQAIGGDVDALLAPPPLGG